MDDPHQAQILYFEKLLSDCQEGSTKVNKPVKAVQQTDPLQEAKAARTSALLTVGAPKVEAMQDKEVVLVVGGVGVGMQCTQ